MQIQIGITALQLAKLLPAHSAYWNKGRTVLRVVDSGKNNKVV